METENFRVHMRESFVLNFAADFYHYEVDQRGVFPLYVLLFTIMRALHNSNRAI